MMRRTMATAAALLAFGAALARGAGESAGARPLTKEQLLHQLTTRESRVELDEARADKEMARAELEQIQRLFDEKVVAADELNKAKQASEKATLRYQTAEIKLQKTQLEFLRDNTFLTVTEARKYRTDDGRYMVAIGLRNDSDLEKSRTLMAEGGVTDEALTNLLTVDNVVVSLHGAASVGAPIIGDPYQQIIAAIRHRETAKIEFDLLDRSVEEATIQLDFLGTKREYTVKLKKDTARDVPTIASIQYAQEGKLGSQIKYDLELERLASSEQSFSLTVLNLPRAIPFAFIDPGSGARVTHIKFTEERSTQHLQLEISIPAKLDAKYVDANIDFTVVVTRPAELAAIGELVKRHAEEPIPAEEILTIKGNRVDLKLIPTGVGKLDILIANLFKEVRKGQPIEFKFTLLNSGTLALRKATPDLELPVEWEGGVEPKTVEVLEPAQKAVLTVRVVPPAGVAVGEYVVKLKADGKAGVETVEAVEKDYTIRLARESNVTGTVVLVAILVLLVLGIAVASIKISRR